MMRGRIGVLSSILLLALGPAMMLASSQQPKPPAKKQAATKSGQAKAEPVPGPLELLWKSAEAAIEKNEFSAALAPLQEFLQQRPDDAFAHFQLGYAFSGLKETEKAETEYRRAIELKPDLAEAHLNLGLSLLDHDPKAAVVPFQRAAELKPKEARMQFLTGLASEMSGDLDQAITRFKSAAELEAASFDAQFALGRVLQAKGKYSDAEIALRTAVSLKNDSPAARMALTQSLLAQHKSEPAARELAAYLNLKPDDREARFQLASLYFDLSENEKSLAELDIVENASAKPEMRFYRVRADVLVHMKKFPEAVAVAQKAVNLAPDNAELHALTGRLYLQVKDFPAAERELLTALKLDGRLLEPRRDLASVYFLAEKYTAMLAVLDELSKKEKPNAGVWFFRAIACDKLHLKPDAIEAYKHFLEQEDATNEDHRFQARQRIRILTQELQRRN